MADQQDPLNERPVLQVERYTASRAFYQAYLNSPDWRVRRNRALQRAGWRCERCEAKRELEVHHRTYERLGREWDQDLEVVCGKCHNEHHLDQAERTHLAVYLKLVRRSFMNAGPLVSIADLSADVKELCVMQRVYCDPVAIQKAIGLIVGTRQNRQVRRRRVCEVAVDNPPFSNTEVARIFNWIGLTRVPLKSIPSAPWSDPDAYVEELARRRALDMEVY